MTNEKPKARKTEFFGAIVFLLISAILLVPALQGRTIQWNAPGIPVSPWQGICAGIGFLGIGVVLLWRTVKTATQKMQLQTPVDSEKRDDEPPAGGDGKPVQQP